MNTGLAIGGGGVAGSAALGVIQALEEAIAALYAYGYSVEELMRIVPRLNGRYLNVDWRFKDGLRGNG